MEDPSLSMSLRLLSPCFAAILPGPPALRGGRSPMANSGLVMEAVARAACGEHIAPMTLG